MNAEGSISSQIRAPGICRAGFAVLTAVLTAAPLGAQDNPPRTLDHRFANVGDVHLEYLQFGDSGTPVIVIQDHHDYFHDYEGPGAFTPEWLDFLQQLGTAYRLVAPVRRGWGASDDPGYGYDVPAQAANVLGLMDALEIRRAVLVGRTAATQEMTWIAERHPERLIALPYRGTPIGHLLDPDPGPEVRRVGQMYSPTACDIGAGSEVDARLTPREAWRRHFARDPDRRIEFGDHLTIVWEEVPLQEPGLGDLIGSCGDTSTDCSMHVGSAPILNRRRCL